MSIKENRQPTRASGRYWGEWIGILAAAAVIALLLRTFVFQTFYIPSESMENTLLVNDRIIVNKISYKTGDLHRGDIVVFEKPPRENADIKDLVKRVIGLPGETVEARNGVVYVNDQIISEPYLKDQGVTDRLPPTVVPEGEVLVLGDNRLNSQDGRVFGTFSQSLIVGKASLRIWPLDRLKYFSD